MIATLLLSAVLGCAHPLDVQVFDHANRGVASITFTIVDATGTRHTAQTDATGLLLWPALEGETVRFLDAQYEDRQLLLDTNTPDGGLQLPRCTEAPLTLPLQLDGDILAVLPLTMSEEAPTAVVEEPLETTAFVPAEQAGVLPSTTAEPTHAESVVQEEVLEAAQPESESFWSFLGRLLTILIGAVFVLPGAVALVRFLRAVRRNTSARRQQP